MRVTEMRPCVLVPGALVYFCSRKAISFVFLMVPGVLVFFSPSGRDSTFVLRCPGYSVFFLTERNSYNDRKQYQLFGFSTRVRYVQSPVCQSLFSCRLAWLFSLLMDTDIGRRDGC